MIEPPPLRARILDAAVRILQEDGIRALTQARVAAAAGIRQSHLQYYFPKRIDLVSALLTSHVDMAVQDDAADGHGHHGSIEEALDLIVANRGRMRFFLGLITEAEREPALRDLVDAHTNQFRAEVAAWFGRGPDDTDVEAFLNTLRGYGLLNLLRATPTPVDVLALARRFGLRRATGRRRTKTPP